ncbi:hypothetical protein QA639_13670 [Bradyrhizobium pachyrhizi]|uniref:hypothetical protein n=1 Tax=Bradyrhizobium pachyrhizi TaxID=280333 RepID=UPI0024B055A1|nr:hypothetical protein [Bradyrhizobium pachyrhizi]WFU60169.1 hypothetical protein QA639_13670 [Bradyrhizobium pachyrhizi]
MRGAHSTVLVLAKGKTDTARGSAIWLGPSMIRMLGPLLQSELRRPLSPLTVEVVTNRFLVDTVASI